MQRIHLLKRLSTWMQQEIFFPLNFNLLITWRKKYDVKIDCQTQMNIYSHDKLHMSFSIDGFWNLFDDNNEMLFFTFSKAFGDDFKTINESFLFECLPTTLIVIYLIPKILISKTWCFFFMISNILMFYLLEKPKAFVYE